MTFMIARRKRIGFVTLVATMMTAASGGDAAANAGKGRHHSRHVTAQAAHRESAKRLHLVSQQPNRLPVRLGAMRYYGGPKSPMWRGPAEN